VFRMSLEESRKKPRVACVSHVGRAVFWFHREAPWVYRGSETFAIKNTRGKGAEVIPGSS
jgi:hypothetical protein